MEPTESKIMVFQVTQRYLANSGLTPNLSIRLHRSNAKTFLGFLYTSTATICCFVFMFKDAKTFVEYTQSTYSCAFSTFSFFCFIIIIFEADNRRKFIDGIENVANMELKHYSASRRIFDEAHRFAEKICEIIFFVVVEVTPIGIYLPWSIYVSVNYFFYNLGNEAFELPFPSWYPFNIKNPIKFPLALATQFFIVRYMMKIGACILSLVCGSFLHLATACKCIKKILFSIGRCTTKIKQSHLKEQLIEFIRFHSSAEQLCGDFSNQFRYILAALFAWSLVTVCGSFLMIQMYSSHGSDNLVVLVIVSSEIVYAFGILLMACELGERVHLAFDESNDIIDQFEWYTFPVKIQRMLPIIMNYTQQPVKIKCIDSVSCDRETFKKIIKNAWSNFTVLRKFYD